MAKIQIEKTVFVIFFSGERAKTKISKICDAFGANCYPFPEESSRQGHMKTEVIYFQVYSCLLIT